MHYVPWLRTAIYFILHTNNWNTCILSINGKRENASFTMPLNHIFIQSDEITVVIVFNVHSNGFKCTALQCKHRKKNR